MAGLFDSYFAKPGSGILGGLYDYPTGVMPEDRSDQAATRDADSLAARRFARRPVRPAATFFGPPSPVLMPPTNPMFTPPAALPKYQFVGPSGASRTGILPPPGPSQSPSDPASLAAAPPDSSPMAGPTSEDFLSRLGHALHDNSSMLMAMGGGMMTGGLGKGFQAGAEAAVADTKQQADNAGRAATVQALLRAGVPPAIAQAAAGNPTLLKAVSARLFR